MVGPRFAVVVVASLASAIVTPSIAQAQSGQDLAIAEALFQQGRDLMADGRLDEACPKFAKSLEIDDKLGTLLNLAVCHQRQGKSATAWAEFTSAHSRALREDRPDRADFAKERMTQLEASLSYLTITSGAGPDATVTLDERPVDPAMLDTKLPVDPGEHVVAATAPGKVPWSQAITIPKGPAELPVTVPELDDDAAASAPPPVIPKPVPPPPPAPVAPARLPTPPPDGGIDGPGILMFSGFGLGAAGLVVGAITGGLTLAKGNDLERACQNGFCPVDQQDELDAANTLANVSNAMFVIAGVGIAAGVVGLVLVSGEGEQTASLRLDVGPTGLTLGGRF